MIFLFIYFCLTLYYTAENSSFHRRELEFVWGLPRTLALMTSYDNLKETLTKAEPATLACLSPDQSLAEIFSLKMCKSFSRN